MYARQTGVLALPMEAYARSTQSNLLFLTTIIPTRMLRRLRFHLSVAIALVLVLGLTGCKTQYVPYHSTADIPYHTESTATSMQLVVGNESMADKRDYLVFAATDNEEIGYVLLAPRKGSSSRGYDFEDANLDRAVPIRRGELEQFIAGLTRSEQMWMDDHPEDQGSFLEFMHAPENEIRLVSEQVVEWRPALQFNLSHSPEGPVARMVLGDSPTDELQYVIELEGRESITDLREVLQEANGLLPLPPSAQR